MTRLWLAWDRQLQQFWTKSKSCQARWQLIVITQGLQQRRADHRDQNNLDYLKVTKAFCRIFIESEYPFILLIWKLQNMQVDESGWNGWKWMKRNENGWIWTPFYSFVLKIAKHAGHVLLAPKDLLYCKSIVLVISYKL